MICRTILTIFSTIVLYSLRLPMQLLRQVCCWGSTLIRIGKDFECLTQFQDIQQMVSCGEAIRCYA